MTQIIIDPTDFSHYNQPHRQWCEELQAKALEILPTQKWRNPDHLLNEAAYLLAGSDIERYTRIYLCENCRQLYHGDYSTNQHETRDFCGAECQVEAGAGEEEDNFEIFTNPNYTGMWENHE